MTTIKGKRRAEKQVPEQPRTAQPVRMWADEQVGMAEAREERADDTSSGGNLGRTLRLVARFRASRTLYIAGLILIISEAATAVISPYPIAFLVDFLNGSQPTLRELGLPEVLPSARDETVLVIALALVIIAVVHSLAGSLRAMCMVRSGVTVGHRIRTKALAQLQRSPMSHHDSTHVGNILARVAGDVLLIETFVVTSISTIVGSLVVVVGSVGFLVLLSWRLALVALAIVPVIALFSRFSASRVEARPEVGQESRLVTTVQEMLRSLRLERTYGGDPNGPSLLPDPGARSARAWLDRSRIRARFSVVIALVEALALGSVVGLGVWLIDRDAITIGTLVLFVLLVQIIFTAVQRIVFEVHGLRRVHAGAERLTQLLDRRVGVADLKHAVEAPRFDGHLKFRRVEFAYPAEYEDDPSAVGTSPVLIDADFELAPGEVVSLVGPRGVGKSTLARLVLRLYDPDAGEILIDGIPIRSLTVSSLRNQVNLIHPDTALLPGSVAENISHGVAGATQEDLEAAAALANAHSFIKRMPDGYETQLDENSNLSDGQRQQLALARAFLRRTPLLVIDEPTLGLDFESAKDVTDALAVLVRGTTTLVISNDPKLIRLSDRVLSLTNGRISEVDPPRNGAHPGRSENPAGRTAALGGRRTEGHG